MERAESPPAMRIHSNLFITLPINKQKDIKGGLMGFSIKIRALCSIISSITVLGVTVVIVDDYSAGTSYTPLRAPITSPEVENITRTEVSPQILAQKASEGPKKP